MNERTTSAVPDRAPLPPTHARGIENVESRSFTIRDFALECGQVLAEATMAYETYGRLEQNGRNALLLAHGFTSSHHGAGRYAAGKAPRGLFEHEPGWWEALVGPGRAIDTDRLFAVPPRKMAIPALNGGKAFCRKTLSEILAERLFPCTCANGA